MDNKITTYVDYNGDEANRMYLEDTSQLGLLCRWTYTCDTGDYNKLILNATIGFLDTGLEDGYESVSGG